MLADPSVFTETNEEGLTRVRREHYAFILPNTIADYIVRRPPCDLVTLGDFLMDKSYAFALAKASILLPGINKALHRLRAVGFLDRLYYKWWIHKSHCNGVTSGRIYISNRSGRSSLHLAFLIVAFFDWYLSFYLASPH